jgi:hypothetical protein
LLRFDVQLFNSLGYLVLTSDVSSLGLDGVDLVLFGLLVARVDLLFD